MFFYRIFLTAAIATALSIPAFAEEVAANKENPSDNPAAVQIADGAATQTVTSTTTTEKIKINLNKATAKELLKVKGINASKARAIVAYRKKHGDFKSLDELTHVKGFKKIKADSLKEIEDQLIVE